jgi:hypothetical protein
MTMSTDTSTIPEVMKDEDPAIPYEAERGKIAVGIGTWTGIISAGAAAAVPFIAWAGDLGLGAPETWAGISAALAALTMLGRYGQAIAAILKGGPPA